MPQFYTPPPDLSNYPIKAEVPNFINGGAFQTVANLLANFPAAVGYRGMYARVSDLWGSVQTVMICEYDGTNYYWRPQRTDYAVTSTQTSGTMSLVPLVTAPEIALQTTLVGAMTVTPSNTNVWPGCQFRILAPPNLGVYTLTITGLIGGLTSLILGGGEKTVVYTANGWRA
ncbi:hypothetical protein CFBP6626_07155 [Agrobacterium tumefaciens]|nr:hypothetical protein CFBP6626_07155 [Agrobacterium tumefaciens]CUX21166.1 hypothetical protein AGR5A_Cc190145 [Agrobacterium genomosp. 5 str. CFBP 6626]